ncbi:hypothetical protein L2E82_15420 [Cichorium intybus]|uniref:Uncharacterized protein n=1 Tax=Cichorium intybus TaxID=13427 RepID=A0ACB9F409_CICIN|nr:hypothetical protein L2E82_15420 [Cichorium intybus]
MITQGLDISKRFGKEEEFLSITCLYVRPTFTYQGTKVSAISLLGRPGSGCDVSVLDGLAADRTGDTALTIRQQFKHLAASWLNYVVPTTSWRSGKWPNCAVVLLMALLSSLKQIFGIESCSLSKDFMPEFFKLVLETLSLPINLPNTNYHHGLQVRPILRFSYFKYYCHFYPINIVASWIFGLPLGGLRPWDLGVENSSRPTTRDCGFGGGHLHHQQGSQQPIGSSFNFPSMENPNSQPSPGEWPSQTFRDGSSVGGMLQQDFKSQGLHVAYNVVDLSTQGSEGGYGVDYATPATQAGFPGSFLDKNSQGGFSRFGTGNDFMSQDYMGHGSQGLFTQVRFKDPSQDDSGCVASYDLDA